MDRDRLVQRVRSLPEDSLKELMDFIEHLEKRGKKTERKKKEEKKTEEAKTEEKKEEKTEEKEEGGKSETQNGKSE